MLSFIHNLKMLKFFLKKQLIFKHKKNTFFRPSMTFEVILYFMKDLCLYNVSIHINFYQNQSINKYARKKKAKISESRSILVRYRRTYILNKLRKGPTLEQTTCI